MRHASQHQDVLRVKAVLPPPVGDRLLHSHGGVQQPLSVRGAVEQKGESRTVGDDAALSRAA
jgi:hypothetical protein